jgi:hypothetical protein
MRRTALIVLALIWISSLAILIVALTDLLANNPFAEYQLQIGIGFLAITGLIGKAYWRVLKTMN